MKIGDKVKRLPQYHGSFSHDLNEIYTITQIRSRGRTICIEDSNGRDRECWDANKFELANKEPNYLEQFKEATKCIGKKGSYKDGTSSRLNIKRVVLASQNSVGDKSTLVHDYLKDHEFCVVCVDGAVCVPFESITVLNYEELKISDQYTAQVYKDKVVVGCQTIPIDTVKELIKLSESI